MTTMEQLLRIQKADIDDLNRLLKNYGSDGPTRKTKEYLQEKQEIFSTAIAKIRRQHDRLDAFYSEDQPYWKEKTFAKIDALYEKVASNIVERLKILAEKEADDDTLKSSGAESSDNDSVEKLRDGNNTDESQEETDVDAIENDTNNSNPSENDIEKNSNGAGPSNSKQIAKGKLANGSNRNRTDENDHERQDENETGRIEPSNNLMLIYSELMDFVFDANQLPDTTSKGMTKTYIELLHSTWAEFRTMYLQERVMGEINMDYQKITRKFMTASGKLNDLLRESTGKNVETAADVQFSLPKLKLPEFSGKATEWKAFLSLFNRMVHNTRLDNGLKIVHLKSCIKGEAARLINHIDANPENYLTCYELLRKRYDNKREMLGKLLDNILNLPKCKYESSENLKTLHDTVYESLMSIKNMDISIDNWDALLTHILLQKLDTSTVIHYECQLRDVREPQLINHFLSYLETRFMALQSANSKCNENKQSNNDKQTSYKNFDKQMSNSSKNCLFCNDTHSIYKCPKFSAKPAKERFEWAKNKRLCTNCLCDSHKVTECKSKHNCKKCNKKHNTLLHFDSIKNIIVSSASAMTAIEPVLNIQATVAIQKSMSVLLATAFVGVFTRNGNKVLLHAMFDQGSQSAFITEEAAQTLGLPRISINANVSGIGARTQVSKSAIVPTVFPRFESEFVMNTFAVVLTQLTRTMNREYDENDFEFTNNIILADPSFMKEAKIDIILGAAEYAQALKCGLIKSNNKNLIAQNTEFGWIISGSVGLQTVDYDVSALVSNIDISASAMVSNIELSQKLNQFFAAEEFEEIRAIDMTNEEAYCEKMFVETTYRNDIGKFVVTLPFKSQSAYPDLGDSRRCAIASQIQLERRFDKNPSLRIKYDEQIREALALGHVEEVNYDSSKQCHYIPHHCVFKDSSTTSMRIVHNASQKTSNGKSLNEQLAIGRIDQDDLTTLLIRFRMWRYAFTADVEKMYKQILVNENQLDLQRFIYRFSPNEHFKDYRLKTVIFGMANAPYLAIRVVRELAERVREKYPIASSIILSSMYVDDVISGCNTVGELCEAYDQLKSTFNSASFNLRKWSSNSSEFLNHIPEIDRETKTTNANVKALGINWAIAGDMFTYNFVIPFESYPKTKRQLTSEIASLFDPLGWLSPVIIAAKHILQGLWLEKCGWDENAPESYIKNWLKIRSELSYISGLKIERFINFDPNDAMELHGFCDAAEIGYAAGIYVKNVNKQTVHLLIAKARVSPIKERKNSANVTIPRLELSAALLLAQLTDKTLKALAIDFKRICLWSDSRIVLDWLHANPKKYRSFIASRIEKILKLTRLSQWSHVRSADNAADCASRGLLPSEIVNYSLWWHGPEFLLNESLEPPRYKPSLDVTIEAHATIATKITIQNCTILPRSPSYYRLKRSMAYVFRFVYNCKNKVNRRTGVLTADEMKTADTLITKCVQNDGFADEISTLSIKKSVSRSSKLISLSPFLDEEGLLRVGGRIDKSDLPYDARHQLLLPMKHPVTSLIVLDCHLKCLHGGPKLTESIVRQKYWICNSQRTIKSVLRNCMQCFKLNPKPMQQYMANLPVSRVKPEKPFARSAVDYTGAFYVKVNSGRGYKKFKAYVAIFVCMTTKSVHVEAVSDMTAEAFIAAFRRLVARRGAVRHIYSDNGTNFVAANKILRENMCQNESEYNELICNELAKCGTSWHFSPPGAPHFNGLAEAGVKTVKRHIRATISETILTFEELSTLLAQIEACVNSRPLCAISSDPNDVGVLTPAHFLVGEPLVNPPEPSHVEAKISWLTKWQRVQKMAQHFWQRWSSDVLNQWQNRRKWGEERDAPKLNDLLLIKDENLPPCQWKLGRVIDLHPGDDGLIRVVTLKCQNGILKRPIVKLCPLPMNGNDITNNDCTYETESQTGEHALNDDVEVTESVQSDVNAICARIRMKTCKQKRMGVLPILTALLAFAITLTHQLPMGEPVEVERFNSSPGLYFEKSYDLYVTGANWNILAFLSLDTLQAEFEAISTNLSSARTFCYTKLDGRVGCRNIVSHLEQRMVAIEKRNGLIVHPHRTKRAALDIIGNIASDLFGIAGPRFVENYSLDMKRMSGNAEVVKELLDNHTSIMESTLNVIKHDREALEKQTHHFNVILNQIRAGRDLDEAEQSLNDAFLYLTQIINEYEKQQQSIMQVVTNSHRNLIDHNLLTIAQIENQVDVMMRQVAGKFIVPSGIDIYALSRVDAHLVGNQYIFKMVVPLFTPQMFRVFRIIRMPIRRNDEFLWISDANLYSHLIVSNERDRFQLVNHFNPRDCNVFLRDDLLVCDKPRLWFDKNKRNCIWNIFNEMSFDDCAFEVKKVEPTLIEIDDNRGIFVFPSVVKLQLSCDDSVLFKSLSGEGILRIKNGCTLRGANAEFSPTLSFDNVTTDIVLPSVNLTLAHSMQIISPEQLQLQFKNNLSDIFVKLNHTKKQLEQLSDLTGFNEYDMHHFSLGYILLLIIVIYIIVKFVKCKRASPTPAPRQCKRISMPTIVVGGRMLSSQNLTTNTL